MRAAATVLAIAAAVLAGVVLVSGGSDADPATPPALPGLPPPFLGTVVTGDGGMTAALDAYGDVVNLYAPGPAGSARIANSSARGEAGTVPTDTGIVPRVRVGGGPALPPWRADSVHQEYVRGTNVVRTVAVFGHSGIGSASSGGAQLIETSATHGGVLAEIVRTELRRGGNGVRSSAATPARASFGIDVAPSLECETGRRGGAVALVCQDRSGSGSANVEASSVNGARSAGGTFVQARATLRRVAGSDRRWLARARPLDAPPPWARRMYERSLLTLRALTGTNGAAAAGAREGWAYVWPRDAAADTIALESAGYPGEARRVARFLAALPIGAAARFDEAGDPVPGRGPQGDAPGWIAAAGGATVPAPVSTGSAPKSDASAPSAADPAGAAAVSSPPWRDLPDYQEGTPGDYLGNAIAAAGARSAGGTKTGRMFPKSSRQLRATAGRAIGAEFGTARGLVRVAGSPGSGLDSAAAWAVRPFNLAPLYPAARRTLLRLASNGARFGITPGEGWTGGVDPWTAPTAWSAWALAGLAAEEAKVTRSVPWSARSGLGPRRSGGPTGLGTGPAAHRSTVDRRAALALLADLRRAATPAGALPERVDAATGLPRSTTPLLWSHAFTVLALRELWP